MNQGTNGERTQGAKGAQLVIKSNTSSTVPFLVMGAQGSLEESTAEFDGPKYKLPASDLREDEESL